MIVAGGLVAALLWWWAAAAWGARPPPLAVPLCCPEGQRLRAVVLQAQVLAVADVASACESADGSPWAPLVYAPARATFFERGRVPPHWRFEGGAVPKCVELRVVPEHAASYAVLANNGSLLLLSGAVGAVPPDRYCADAGAALACAENVPRAPSKCCSEGRAFDGTRCIEDEPHAAEVLEELRALVNGSVVGGGWPACAGGSRYSVAGSLRGARLLADGALELEAEGGRGEPARLSAGAWCAEAAAGEGGARVYACEREAHAPAPARAARHVLYGAGLAVGAAFLAATLAAGFALPAAHHALHWRCQTHYVAALMLGDVLLAATQLAADRVPPTLCRALGELFFSNSNSIYLFKT